MVYYRVNTMKNKNKARIDFWVEKTEKVEFDKLCKEKCLCATKIIRRIFQDKLTELRAK